MVQNSGIYVLARHWHDETVCDEAKRRKWRGLALVFTTISVLNVAVVALSLTRRALDVSRDVVLRARKTLDTISLMW
jgi:hypothetical protein